MYCKNVGARRADILRKELHVNTALDLLQQYPYRYVDRSKFYTIAQIEDEDTAVQIIGTITEWHPVGVGKAQRISATFNDGTHTCELVWFQGIKYLKLELNTPYLLSVVSYIGSSPCVISGVTLLMSVSSGCTKFQS